MMCKMSFLETNKGSRHEVGFSYNSESAAISMLAQVFYGMQLSFKISFREVNLCLKN